MWLCIFVFVKDHMDYIISSYGPEHTTTNDYCKLYDELNLYLLSEKSLTINYGTSMIIQITYMLPHAELRIFIKKQQYYGNEHVPSSLSISCTGLSVFQLDMIDTTNKYDHVMDVIALPVALLVLHVMLRMNALLFIVFVIVVGTTMNARSIVMSHMSQFI